MQARSKLDGGEGSGLRGERPKSCGVLALRGSLVGLRRPAAPPDESPASFFLDFLPFGALLPSSN